MERTERKYTISRNHPSAEMNDYPGEYVWHLKPGERDYPALLSSSSGPADWPIVYGFGNREILDRNILGLICSIQCPGSVVIKTFDAVRELRDSGVVFAGGFHSPMEQECLEFLLRGEQPIVICPARRITPNRLPSEWKKAIASERLLLLSTFGEDVKRVTKVTAQIRNEFVASLSAALLVPHASTNGKVESTALGSVKLGKKVFTLDDQENGTLLDAGATLYSLGEIERSGTARQ